MRKKAVWFILPFIVIISLACGKSVEFPSIQGTPFPTANSVMSNQETGKKIIVLEPGQEVTLFDPVEDYWVWVKYIDTIQSEKGLRLYFQKKDNKNWVGEDVVERLSSNILDGMYNLWLNTDVQLHVVQKKENATYNLQLEMPKNWEVK
jgi:hypothetical protein